MRTELKAVAEPARTRLDYWRGTVGTLFAGLEVELEQGPDVRDAVVYGDVGQLRVIESRSGPGVARRTMRHVRRHDPQRYMVFVQLDGFAIGEHNDRSFRFEPGDLGLVDLSKPLRCVHSERRAVMVSYPKQLCPLRPDEMFSLVGARIPANDGTAALVASLAEKLPDHLDADDGAGGARIGSAVLDLVNVSLAAQVDRDSALTPAARDRALVLRCRAYVEENLADPRLSPTTIAAAHHISVRNLHRLFEASGDGVAGWIRRRRLDRCRRELLDPHLEHRPVWAVGARWGFKDAAHFTRTFKAAYGLPPAEFRATFSQR